jgi:hypothetical protein
MIARFLCGAALLTLPVADMAAGQDAAGAAAVVHVTGHLRDAATGEPVSGWQVIISGPALARNENSALILSSGPQGEFDFQVPAGSYELETASGRFEDAHVHLDAAAGVGASHDFDLSAAAASNAYVTQDVRTPQQMVPEVSGITFSPGGNLVAVSCRGEVWMRLSF